MISERLFLAAGLLAVGILLVFQIANLTTMSMWHDEAFSGLLIQYEQYEEMMHRIGLDVHPPLYYILLRFWAEFLGASVFSIRFFSLIFGLGTAIGVFLLAKEIFKNVRLALLSAILLALSSFQVQYHLEARMYTLAAFFLVFATLFLLRTLKENDSPRSSLFWLGSYVLFATAALYTHYYTLFALLGHGIFILYSLRFHFKKLILFATGVSAIAILYLPWLPTFLRQLSQVEAAYWIPAMNVWSIPTTVTKMVIGDGLNPPQAAFFIIFINFVILASFGILFLRYKITSRFILPAIFFAPFAGALLLSLRTPIYLDRYFILYLPFLFITIAAGSFAFPSKTIRPFIVAALLLGAAISYPVHWQSWNLGHKPGMAGASSYILSSAKANDIILVNSSFVYFTFRYYNTTSIHPLLYAPSTLAHFSGTALLNEEDMIHSFQDVTIPGNVVWTIDTTGFGNFQPTVPASWQKQEEKEFADAYPHRGSIIIRKYLVQD